MTSADLLAAGLQANDVVLDPASGRFDHLPLVTDFRMKTVQDFGDYSGDGQLDCQDLDALELAIGSGSDNLRYDIDGDAALVMADLDFWIRDVFETLPGDANLDRVVDGLDFVIWNNHKFGSGGWCDGDFNHDGSVDGSDFIVWNDFKFTSAANVAVPEPSAIVILLGFLVGSLRALGRIHKSK